MSERHTISIGKGMLLLLLTGVLLFGMITGEVINAFIATTHQPVLAAPGNKGSTPVSLTPEQIYDQASSAVVSIHAQIQSQRRFGPQGEDTGTGFVIDPQGLILTNNHVIAGSTKVTVTLSDGTNVNGTVVGSTQADDLALLKINPPHTLTALSFGDSSALKVGDPVYAIGSPFGLDESMTAGIISALNRVRSSSNGASQGQLIQTDAAINPGNSGGPLLNAQGEVIGINQQIESPVQGNVGVGFAIPANRAKSLLGSLQSGQTISTAWLGISGISLTSDVAQQFNLSAGQGVIVASVVSNSPAEKAGLRAAQVSQAGDISQIGDIITEVDGKSLSRIDDLVSLIQSKHPGDTITLTVLRDGQTQSITVTLGSRPENP